jgi:hypothetical protein
MMRGGLMIRLGLLLLRFRLRGGGPTPEQPGKEAGLLLFALSHR